MKTLQSLYAEITGSDALKKAYLEAAKGGKVADFLKANGCEATAEEIKAFLKEKADQELSDAELDSVAGGTCNGVTWYEMQVSIISVGIVCAADAAYSAATGRAGQKSDSEGRLCNVDED